MTLSSLIDELVEIVRKNPAVGAQAEVMIRLRDKAEFQPMQLTLTYVGKRRQGTTNYDQTPIVLFEVKEEEADG